MRLALLLCMLAFFLVFCWLMRLRLQSARLQSEVDRMRDQLAAGY